MEEVISVHLGSSDPDLWRGILDGFVDVVAGAETKLNGRVERFGASETERTRCVGLLRRRAWEGARKRLEDELGSEPMLLLKLRTRLEERFKYDEAGLPKVWKPEDDMDGAFAQAKEAADRLIPLYARIVPEASTKVEDFTSYFRLPPPLAPEGMDPLAVQSSSSSTTTPTDLGSMGGGGGDDDEEEEYESWQDTLVILSPAKQREVQSRFKREADASFLEAKRSLVATEAHVPYWMIGLIVVLGWNEFWAILTSPMYLITCMMLGFIGYVVWMLGLTGQVEGVARMLAWQVTKLLQGQLNSAMSGGSAPSTSSGSSGSNQKEEEDVELKKME